MNNISIHQTGRIYAAGTPIGEAKAVMVMVHGRGDSAQGILSLSAEFPTEGVAYIAPHATNNTWYPNSFLAPLESNEPFLSSALQAIDNLVNHLIEEKGVQPENLVLLGFSQGACLSLEYAARNTRHYGGVVALSGGLIGPDGTPRDYPGSLDGTPVFLGCSDVDFHIPEARVHESAAVMEKLGGIVTKRIYPGMGHTVNDDELQFVRDLLSSVTQNA